jgi:hypothetical protein
MRINLLFLDIFSRVIRSDKEKMDQIDKFVKMKFEPNFFSYLMTKENEVRRELELITAKFDDVPDEERAALEKKYDKDLVDTIMSKLKLAGFEMIMSMIDKITMNKMLIQFFHRYFACKAQIKLNVEMEE